MKDTKPNTSVPVELRLQNVSLTSERKEFLKANLGKIPDLVHHFPVSQLHADLHKHPHRGDYHIKMSLRLNNETLFTGERDNDLMVAWRRCTTQMAANVKAFKQKLAREHTYKKAHAFEE